MKINEKFLVFFSFTLFIGLLFNTSSAMQTVPMIMLLAHTRINGEVLMMLVNTSVASVQ